MELILQRYLDSGKSTIGVLEIKGFFEVFTLEDTYRFKKIWGETRIPSGTYEIKLRTEGGMHESYKKKYDFHKGMLWLQDVPNFKDIYIHIGNTAENTRGCILVGSSISNNNFIAGSSVAYIRLYFKVIEAFDRGEKVSIKIIDN